MRPASNDFLDVAYPGGRAAIADNALCAEVRFVADFSDGSRVWLAECPLRDPLLTAEEQRPFEAPVPLSTPIGQPLDSTAARTEHVSATLASTSGPVPADDSSRPPQKRTRDAVQADGINRTKAQPRTMKRRDKPKPAARFENDFSLAVIPQRKGEPLRLTIEPELQSLLKRIIQAGGSIPRTMLRKDKTDTFQPEKLLRSQTAQTLVKTGLLGSQRNGRTTVFWAKSQAD
jgi:hypothetical protein